MMVPLKRAFQYTVNALLNTYMQSPDKENDIHQGYEESDFSCLWSYHEGETKFRWSVAI